MAVIKATRDPRMFGYAITALVLLAIGLLAGQPVTLAGAVPFALVVALGTRDRAPRPVEVAFAASSTTLVEGDMVDVQLTVPRAPGVETHLQLDLGPGWEVDDPEMLHLEAPDDGSPAVLTVPLRATWWGRTSPGIVSVTHRASGDVVQWDHKIAYPAQFRVLPPPAKVRELLPPPVSHSLIGAHGSKTVGDGFDFAELRPYEAGDRLRDVNWRATARYGDPHVNRRHPDRNGDVVIVLDTYPDIGGGHSKVMQAIVSRAARAAWSISRLHLGAQDRVGLAAHGRIMRSVPVGGGDHARYRLLEALLDVGGSLATGKQDGVMQARLRVPPAALVIALTTLSNDRMVDELIALRAAGRSVVVVVIDVLEALPAPRDVAEVSARRLYADRLTLLRERLINEGMPMATWHDEASLTHVVAVLRHLQGARLVRR